MNKIWQIHKATVLVTLIANKTINEKCKTHLNLGMGLHPFPRTWPATPTFWFIFIRWPCISVNLANTAHETSRRQHPYWRLRTAPKKWCSFLIVIICNNYYNNIPRHLYGFVLTSLTCRLTKNLNYRFLSLFP